MFREPYAVVALDALSRQRLLAVSSATVALQLEKRGLRRVFMPGLRMLGDPRRRLVGPAYTLRNIPVREDIAHAELRADPHYPQRHCIEAAPPGSVLVIEAGADRGAGQLGDILVARLALRGVAGVLSDGCMRDAEAVGALDIPVVCAGGAAPAALSTHYAVASQVPIGCGGVAVFPGDVIVADGDGAVVIPSPLAAAVAADAVEQEAYELYVQERIRAGDPITGLYPASTASRAAFERQRKAGESGA